VSSAEELDDERTRVVRLARGACAGVGWAGRSSAVSMDAGTCGRVVDGGTGADADGGCACSGMGDDTMLACRMRAMRVVMSSESLESSSEEEARRACFPVERESPRRGMLRLEACCCTDVDGALGAVATTGMTTGGGGRSGGDVTMCWGALAFGVNGAGTGAAG